MVTRWNPTGHRVQDYDGHGLPAHGTAACECPNALCESAREAAGIGLDPLLQQALEDLDDVPPFLQVAVRVRRTTGPWSARACIAGGPVVPTPSTNQWRRVEIDAADRAYQRGGIHA